MKQAVIRVFPQLYPQLYTHRGFLQSCQWWMLDKSVSTSFLPPYLTNFKEY
ncbi:unannotated protein [freshwater metagenome]|uniref:Unannotated protein n=1 Tax=freshwater metagenome TaxID=449393 RepID=A0A6J6CMQ0_9ZZZZ